MTEPTTESGGAPPATGTSGPEVRIKVQGSRTARLRPERATVHGRIVLEGDAATSVLARAEQGRDALVRLVEGLHDPAAGPVTWFAVDQLRTAAHRPWNDKGKQLPLVHTATVGLEVKFSDFSALAGWTAQAVAVEGFRVDRIEWALTEQKRHEVERTVQQEAVREARRRAQAYADALDLGQVQPRRIADPGLLGDGAAPGAPGGMALRAAGAADGGGAPELVPRDVVVTAQVEAEFGVPR